MLRALTRLRSAGWGIALDDVGGDSRSLALMSILYPDVIKLDLRLLAERAPQDVARIVTAVGGEAERRHATVLAEGIDSDELLDTARAYGATLGQGYLLGPPEPLPAAAPRRRAARCGCRAPAADPFGPTPWERVTNWRRPTRGPRELALRAARMLVDQAAQIGETAMVLISLADDRHGHGSVERYGWLPDRVAFVGVLNAGRAYEGDGRARRPARGRTTRCRAPARSSCSRPTSPPASSCASSPTATWAFAVTYDRDTVVECALPLMARMEPLSAVTRAASSAITLESCPPCHASGDAPGLLGAQLGARGSPRRSARRPRRGGRGRPRRGWRRRPPGRRARPARPTPRTGASAGRRAARRRPRPGCSCAASRWCSTLVTVSRHASGTPGSP